MTHGSGLPSAWICRFAPLVRAGGTVLDVAAGGGRHSDYFVSRGHPVTAIDRDISALQPQFGLEILQADLETSDGWPLSARKFNAIVMTNYLWRPILPDIIGALASKGVLLIETFGIGNEQFGRPKNPDFLLRPGELLTSTMGLTVVAYESGIEALGEGGHRVVQRICAVNGEGPFRLP